MLIPKWLFFSYCIKDVSLLPNIYFYFDLRGISLGTSTDYLTHCLDVNGSGDNVFHF